MNTTYGTMYYVKDMKQAVTFYKNKLGLSVAQESNDWTEFTVGGHNLCLHLMRAQEKPIGNGILIFKQDNIKSLFDKMKGDGLNVFDLKEVHPGGWSFNVNDEDSNTTSFYGTP